MIVNLLTDSLGNLLHVLRQRHNHLQMLVAQAQTTTDSLKLIRTCRVLSTSHRSGKIVTDDNGDVCILVDGIQQTRHSRVRKRRVADDGNSRPLSCITGTFRHRDRSTHVDTRVDGFIRRQET